MYQRDGFDHGLLDGGALDFLIEHKLSPTAAEIARRVKAQRPENLTGLELHVFKTQVADAGLVQYAKRAIGFPQDLQVVDSSPIWRSRA